MEHFENLTVANILWYAVTIALYGWGLVWGIKRAVRMYKNR